MRSWVRGAVPAISPLLMLALGCAAGIPKGSLVLTPAPPETRRLETRRYPGVEEGKLISGAAGALQEMGYTLEQNEAAFGLVVGSKKFVPRNTKRNDAPVTGSLLGSTANPAEKEQVVRASVTVVPYDAGRPGTEVVRITFQRVIWNTRNEVTGRERLVDPQIYYDFFEKLSKAVSMEGQEI